MATAAAAEHTEAMEQVGEEERAEGEAIEQVAGEERAEEAPAEAEAEAADAMEQDQGEVEAEAPAEEAAEADASDEGHADAMEEEEEEVQAEVEGDAAEAEAEAEAEALSTVLPLSRVKKIIRVDRDIKKVTAEASLLIAAATELFLGSLAAGAHAAATERGRRGVRAADIRAAARAHRPTADFLLDCLPAAEEAPSRAARSGPDAAAAAPAVPKPLPRGTRRIDGFFQKVT